MSNYLIFGYFGTNYANCRFAWLTVTDAFPSQDGFLLYTEIETKKFLLLLETFLMYNQERGTEKFSDSMRFDIERKSFCTRLGNCLRLSNGITAGM